MAIKLTDTAYCAYQKGNVCEYVCDTPEDVASLPKCCTKSTALVVSTGDVYVVNASGEWVLFGG